ncbi:Hypothetical protein D9617_10g071950 [Elsinoe fawcettii]|nr:Hypothetical protein D9617_10g071950 [Elsinoe fawcettii]
MTASEPPSPGIGTYTVGWIAALPVERAAAVALLDEKHQTPKDFNKHQQDDNAYTWGRSGQHYVVVASLPAGTYGLVSAANTAGSMKFSLPHLRICFMVGIGAGIPRHRQDVRLGDVVVGIPAGNTPGVIQYDLGRLGRDGALDRVGALNRPPQVILNGVAKLQSEHLQNPPRINQIHEDMIKRSPYMAGEDVGPSYLYQGADNDRLIVLRYYFTFTESAKQTFENMVRTFIADLAHVNETNKEGLIGLHARHRSRRSEPSLTELCKFLSALMRQETSLWIILDALDECRLADLPETVNWIMTETTANLDLHILLTSRPELDIQTVIAKARSSCDMIQLDAMANRKDIESFTLARVKVGWRLQRWKAHPAIQDKIIGAIMKKADGI